MEVKKTLASSALRLELQVGVGVNGNPTLRRRNLANVKSTANDQDLFEIAAAIGGLQKYPLYAVTRVDNAQLEQA